MNKNNNHEHEYPDIDTPPSPIKISTPPKEENPCGREVPQGFKVFLQNRH
jgi:hypothetical protein